MSVYCRNNHYLSHELNEILRYHGEEIESSESESRDNEYHYDEGCDFAWFKDSPFSDS